MGPACRAHFSFALSLAAIVLYRSAALIQCGSSRTTGLTARIVRTMSPTQIARAARPPLGLRLLVEVQPATDLCDQIAHEDDRTTLFAELPPSA
jgi:hypothetical protein